MSGLARRPRPQTGQGASLPLIAAALDDESLNAMAVANRFRYVFLLLLSAVMLAFRNDATALPSAVALLFFWISALANTVVLRHGDLKLSHAFNYFIAVLDCTIIRKRAWGPRCTSWTRSLSAPRSSSSWG